MAVEAMQGSSRREVAGHLRHGLVLVVEVLASVWAAVVIVIDGRRSTGAVAAGQKVVVVAEVFVIVGDDTVWQM